MKIEFKNGLFEVNIKQIILVRQDTNTSSITEIEIEQVSSNQKAMKIKGNDKWILSQHFLQYEFIDTVNNVNFPSIFEYDKSKWPPKPPQDYIREYKNPGYKHMINIPQC